MIIRSITYTIDLQEIENLNYQNHVENRISNLKFQFSKEEIVLRTLRFNSLLISMDEELSINSYFEKLTKLRMLSERCGVRWFNLSLKLGNCKGSLLHKNCEYILSLIREFPELFVNIVLPSTHILDTSALKVIVNLLTKVSKISSNGFDSFRFGFSCNPVVNTPFFPYSFGDKDHRFSIALETINSISDALSSSKKSAFNDRLDLIKHSLIKDFVKIDLILDKTKIKSDFAGFDASLAPFPDDNISVLDVLEQLGMNEFGSYGTVFLTESLTRTLKMALDEADVRSTGFNGVMYSLLEDKRLCKDNNFNKFDINSLMLYSTVCGCGLDMLPIQGEFIEEEIVSLILDVSTLARRHNKPLGIRLLPIPFKWVGDRTEFNMDFLSDTQLMKLKNNYILV